MKFAFFLLFLFFGNPKASEIEPEFMYFETNLDVTLTKSCPITETEGRVGSKSKLIAWTGEIYNYGLDGISVNRKEYDENPEAREVTISEVYVSEGRYRGRIDNYFNRNWWVTLFTTDGQEDNVDAYTKRRIKEKHESAKQIRPKLKELVQKGSLDEIELLGKDFWEGVDMNQPIDEEGNTALIYAAGLGHLKVVKYLCLSWHVHAVRTLANGKKNFVASWGREHNTFDLPHIELNKKNYYGWTALHAASRGGHVDVVKFLAHQGAWLNTRNEFGSTPIHAAAYGGHTEVVEFLLNKGVDLQERDDDAHTPSQVTKTDEYRVATKEHEKAEKLIDDEIYRQSRFDFRSFWN